MVQVDALRKESDLATENYRTLLRTIPKDMLLDHPGFAIVIKIKEQTEQTVLLALAARWACPPCPFKCGGIVIPTSTDGRSECEKCGAICLRGHR